MDGVLHLWVARHALFCQFATARGVHTLASLPQHAHRVVMRLWRCVANIMKHSQVVLGHVSPIAQLVRTYAPHLALKP